MFASRTSSSSTPSSLSDSPPLPSHTHTHTHPSLAHSLSQSLSHSAHSAHSMHSHSSHFSAATSHAHSLSGSPSLLSPSVSPSAAAVLIDDLPLSVGETELLLLLKPCGRVRAINMNRHAHKSASYAIVELATIEQAEAARQQLNGQIFFGAVLKVFSYTIPKNNLSPHSQQPLHAHSQGHAHSHAQGQGAGGRSRYVRTAQVHISYLSKQLNLIVNEHFIRDIFSNFGEVLEVSLKKMCVDAEMCIQNGYGFVHFPLSAEGIKSAFQAVEALHQVTINQISYDCSVSNQLRQVLSQMDRDPALRQQLLASRPSHAHTQPLPQSFSHSQATSAASSWTSSSSPASTSVSASVSSSLSPSVFDPLSYSPPQNPLSGPAARGGMRSAPLYAHSHNTHTHSFHDRYSSERERERAASAHAHTHRTHMPSLARSPHTLAHSLSQSHSPSPHDSLLSNGSFNGSHGPHYFNGSLGGSGLLSGSNNNFNNNNYPSNSFNSTTMNNNININNNINNNSNSWLASGIAGNDTLFGFASNTTAVTGSSDGNGNLDMNAFSPAASWPASYSGGERERNGLWSNPLTSRETSPRDALSVSLAHSQSLSQGLSLSHESVRETEREGDNERDTLLAPSPRKHSHSFSLTHNESLSLPLGALSLSTTPQQLADALSGSVCAASSLSPAHSQSLSARTAEEERSATSTARTDDSLSVLSHTLSHSHSLVHSKKKEHCALSIDEQLQALWFDA